MSYFREIVLPSVGMPKKAVYTLQESCHILGVSERSIKRKARIGQLKIIEDQINYEEFERFFAQKPGGKPGS